MVTDRTRALTEIVTTLYRRRHGQKVDKTKLKNLRGALKRGSAKLGELVRQARDQIQTLLQDDGVLSANGVTVSQREQRSLLAHIDSEEFADVLDNVEVRWVKQLKLTRSEIADVEGLNLTLAEGP